MVKSVTLSLTLVVPVSSKLQDKSQNRKPGFDTSKSVSFPGLLPSHLNGLGTRLGEGITVNMYSNLMWLPPLILCQHTTRDIN